MVINTIKTLLNPIELLTKYLNPLSSDFIFTKLFEHISGLFDVFNVDSDNFLFSDFFKKIGNIVSYLNPLSDNFFVYKLIELLGDLLKTLFVPSEESVNSLVNSVKSKFGFIDTISNISKLIEDMFKDTSTLPKLTLNLNNNKWYSGEITVIDLSWYAPYKQYGDTIISSFIYVFFIWRIFIKLPSIVNGTAGGVNDIISISKKGD